MSKQKEIVNQPNVASQKLWMWVQTMWSTCPSSMTLNEFYDTYRDQLYEMYTSQTKLVEDKAEN